MDGGHLNCHQNLGLALKNVGKVDEAIGEMREAVRLGDGGEVNSFYNLGEKIVGRRTMNEVENALSMSCNSKTSMRRSSQGIYWGRKLGKWGG